MPDNHWSDCRLHWSPAYRPGWCNCGGVERQPSFLEKLEAWIVAQYLYFTGQS